MFGIFAPTCMPLRVASVASFQLGLRIELVLSEFFSSHALILSGCPNMTALLAELDKAKQSLTQTHSFHSIGAFEGYAYNFEGDILLETMMIARAVTWSQHGLCTTECFDRMLPGFSDGVMSLLFFFSLSCCLSLSKSFCISYSRKT